MIINITPQEYTRMLNLTQHYPKPMVTLGKLLDQREKAKTNYKTELLRKI